MTATASTAPGSSHGRRWVLPAAVAALLLVGAVVWGVSAVGGSSDGGAAPVESATATATATPTPSGSVVTPSPEPSQEGAQPGAAGDGAAAAPPTTAEAGVPAFGAPVTAPVEAPVEVAEGVEVTVTGLESIDGDGIGPGEIDGPAVRFVVRVANNTAAEISLLSAVVNAYFGESATPGIQLSGSGAKALPATVAPGSQAEGVYVFLLPDDRSPVRVEVYSVPQAAVVMAEGPTPEA